MMDPQVRLSASVSPENRFLFPTTGGSKNSLNATNEFAAACRGAKLEGNLTPYSFRHYIVTQFFALDKTSEERKWLAIHYGHSEEMQKSHYAGLNTKKMVLTLADNLKGIRENMMKTGQEEEMKLKNDIKPKGIYNQLKDSLLNITLSVSISATKHDEIDLNSIPSTPRKDKRKENTHFLKSRKLSNLIINSLI